MVNGLKEEGSNSHTSTISDNQLETSSLVDVASLFYESKRRYERLRGKTALVTGGDSIMGRAIISAFIREGADVVFSYSGKKGVSEEIVSIGYLPNQHLLPVACDIQKYDDCKSLITSTLEAFGKIDILVNNASYQIWSRSISEITPEEFDRSMKTNVYSTFYLTKEALKHMSAGSSIINTTSIQGYEPSHVLAAYAAAKGAVTIFTKAVAKESIKRGVRVNAIAPGPVRISSILDKLHNCSLGCTDADLSLGRSAQPEDFAPMYVFLASDGAGDINGQVWGTTETSQISR
jgi:NAD(P)-dependent dehydrogenase (short-subunit alcohol dehydrogenase family)